MASLEELDRQVERGSLFTQATLERAFRRIGNAEGLLSRLIEQLLAAGVLTAEELGVTLQDPPAEAVEPDGDGADADGAHADGADGGEPTASASSAITWPSVTMRVDPEDAGDEPEVTVDCAARISVCHAVCCRLKFPLSPEEVDAGTVKWDIGHPYIIRQSSDGYCSHHDQASGGCRVYDDRPRVCRRYSCAGDTRIWTDFDNMVLNQGWIDANLHAADLHVARVIPPMEVPVTLGPARNGAHP
jgi:Fe-S-cluster containining protein